jgi:DNA mismatch repair protein MutS
MIYDDYEEYLKTYKDKYGINTIVLMECGSFFEIYDDGNKNTDLKMIGELLGIQVSRRNKAIIEVSRSNLEMAGFPSYALNKFLAILTRNNYTVVVVSQVTPPPNPKREVTHIVSPGTFLGDDSYNNVNESNYMMCVYLEKFAEFKTKLPSIVIGVSLIDLGTGKTYCQELCSRANDTNYPLDELYRICASYSPREVLISGDYSSLKDIITFDKLVSYLDINDRCSHNDIDKFDNKITKIAYQKEILKRVFPFTGLLDSIEYIGLELKPCALISYVRLLQFINSHNESILTKVKPPQVIEESNTLILSYNSVKQLDILPQNTNWTTRNISKTQSLYDILNNCKTPVGRRYFKERLMTPMKRMSDLCESYDNIEILMDKDIINQIRHLLNEVYDIERLFRRVDIGNINPSELWNLDNSLEYLKKSVNIITALKTTKYLSHNVLEYIDSIRAIISNNLVIDELPKYNLDNISASIFQKGIDSKIDNLYNEYIECKQFFQNITNSLNELSKESIFKLESNDRDGYYLLVTNKRYKDFIKSHEKKKITLNELIFKVSDFTSKNVSHSSSNIKINHIEFNKYNDRLEVLESRLKKMVIDCYKVFLNKLSETTEQYSVKLCETLAYIDFYCCCAFNAFNFKYTRPTIKDVFSSKSYVNIKGLRHPIIERISVDTQYISNDISLGLYEEHDGILLYGLNSSGKSSLMKSVGIAVVMAQAGMYVACDNMEYYPYDYIFTRILSSDDIFKGQSTFTKEMMELRGILKRANSNSMVLGDELCSGTESISALSIVSAGIYSLAQRKTSFIFATHLHDLVSIPTVNLLCNVKAYHLSVIYDIKTKHLIYDRILKEGNGSTLYGLEVCKSLDLDNDFLQLANTVRHNLLNTQSNILSTTSNHNKYNRKVYLDTCSICGEHAQEIHHISQQKDADNDGYIGNFHKNSKFNLVCLCEKCHDNVHRGSIDIIGYKQTSEGVILDYKMKSSNDKNKHEDTKDDDKMISILDDIKTLVHTIPKLKKTDIITSIMSKYPNITKYKIDKLIKSFQKVEINGKEH